MRRYKSAYAETRKDYNIEWRTWLRMIRACRDNHKYYVETSVCREWLGEKGFLNWLDHIGPKPGFEYIHDRINKLEDYKPGNVRWTSKTESQNNQRKHLQPEERAYWGKIAKSNGISKHTFFARVHDRGWDVKDAATLPPSQIKYKNRLV